MAKDTPRNEEGQPPTQGSEETAQRLEEKARSQTGQANRDRTAEKIDEIRREKGTPGRREG